MNVKVSPKSKKNTEIVEIGLLIDESGSMGKIRGDTIGTINNFLMEQKAVKGKANISISSFNDIYKRVVERCDIQQVQEITEEDYCPKDCTALFDAIMQIITEMEYYCMVNKSNRAILAIMTDGDENASTGFKNASEIKTRIQQKQEQGWQIIFLGANINEKEYAQNLGINLNLTQKFDATPIGIRSAGLYATQCVTNYRNQE